jgi:CDP-glucose 4,6-dehydratase
MNFWENRNVFVTGGTGILGSWLVEELFAKQANIVCLLRDWVPNSKLTLSKIFERISVVRGELEDYGVLVRALNEYEIDTVFHLGAQTIVGTATRSALSTFESNIKGTWNLLEACKVCSPKVERVIVASSDKAYGASEKLPYTEETPLRGQFPYDVSKSCADLISFAYYHTYRIPVAITRCGNLFGGGDLNFNRLVPGTIRSALQGESPIIRSDGTFIRDYFYVRDAVDAYLMLAERMPEENLIGQAFNFGNESPVRVLDLVEMILQLVGRTDLKPQILNEAQQEIPKQFLNCSKARSTLNWRPRFSLQDGLQETIAWYKDWFSHL